MKPRFKGVKIPRLLKEVEKQAKAKAMKRLQEVAQIGVRRLKDDIQEQRLRSFKRNPLSPARVAEKKRKGLDPRTLIATKTYINGIEVIRMSATSMRIGFADNACAVDEDTGKKTSLKLNDLARIHEFGTTKIPPRPHFGPTAAALRADLKAGRI